MYTLQIYVYTFLEIYPYRDTNYFTNKKSKHNFLHVISNPASIYRTTIHRTFGTHTLELSVTGTLISGKGVSEIPPISHNIFERCHDATIDTVTTDSGNGHTSKAEAGMLLTWQNPNMCF